MPGWPESVQMSRSDRASRGGGARRLQGRLISVWTPAGDYLEKHERTIGFAEPVAELEEQVKGVMRQGKRNLVDRQISGHGLEPRGRAFAGDDLVKGSVGSLDRVVVDGGFVAGEPVDHLWSRPILSRAEDCLGPRDRWWWQCCAGKAQPVGEPNALRAAAGRQQAAKW